jgi:hypothetical protein
VLLQYAQQLDLDFGWKLANLIEKDRAATGKFKPSDTLFGRSRKSSLFVTEEFAFDKTGRQCGAVDLNQRPITARTGGMYCTRDQFLAGSGLSQDQNSGVGECNQADLIHHGVQRRAAADDLVEVVELPDFLLEVLVLGLQPSLFLFHQHSVGDVEKHYSRVLAIFLPLRPPLSPYRTAVFLSTQLQISPARLGSAFNQL